MARRTQGERGEDPPRRRTQRERTEDSRRRLVEAATVLIGAKGYAGTTLAEIGRAAGVSRGLVTYHFGTKEACVRAVLDDLRSRVRRAVGPAEGEARGLGALEGLVGRYLASYPEGDPGGRAVFVAIAESVSSTPELREAMAEQDEEFRGIVAQLLREAAEDGEVDGGVDAGLHAVLVVGLLRGVALQWLVREDAVDLDRAVPACAAMVRASLPVAAKAGAA